MPRPPSSQQSSAHKPRLASSKLVLAQGKKKQNIFFWCFSESEFCTRKVAKKYEKPAASPFRERVSEVLKQLQLDEEIKNRRLKTS